MAHFLLLPTTTTLLILLLLSPPPTLADDTPAVVLDINRNPVEPGSDYYIRPLGVYGGGIRLHEREDANECPRYIGLSHRGLTWGEPIELLPISNSTKANIHVSEELNIVTYTDPKKCSNQVWMVKSDRTQRIMDVVTGGVVGKPGADTAYDSRFKIENAYTGDNDNIYVFRYCPSIEAHLRLGCGYLGSYWDTIEGKFFLHSSSIAEPLRFYFVKASGRKELEITPPQINLSETN